MSEEITRIPVKTLTKMMVAGQNQVVMKYLRTLPSEECAEVREQLIKNLELIQQQQKKSPSSTPTGKSDSPTPVKKESSKESSSSSKSSSNNGSGTARRNKSNPTSTSKDQSTQSKDIKGSGLQITTARDSRDDDSSDKTENRPQVGNYIYQKDLGKGQFGVVFKAKHSVSGIRVAIKEIDTDQVSTANLPGVMKEAEVMSELNHPNCLKIFEVIKTKKKIYFILDYINRGSLLGLIKTQGNFPESVAAYCIKFTCEGLKYLHGRSIIHRDIKCANILINDEGMLKLADFGTAKEDAGKNFTVIGTPFWMAPEIIEVSGATTVSDIWSLGCTIVEMLRGTPPYFELVTMQALFKIVEDPHPPIPSTFSDEIKNFLIKNCFVKDIKKRNTAEGIIKSPWICNWFDKIGPNSLDYNKICALIKGGSLDSPTNASTASTASPSSRITSKGKGSSSSKYPTAPIQSSSTSSGNLNSSGSTGNISSSAKYPSQGSKALRGDEGSYDLSVLAMSKLQLEIEQLSREQLKLQKDYDTIVSG